MHAQGINPKGGIPLHLRAFPDFPAFAACLAFTALPAFTAFLALLAFTAPPALLTLVKAQIRDLPKMGIS